MRNLLFCLRIFCFAVAVPALSRLPLPRLQALLEPRGTPPHLEPAGVERIARSVLAVLRLGRPLVRRGCLTRGLTLYYFLRRAGVDVKLCFGIGTVPEGDGFDGHCWLVKDEAPFLEARDPRPVYTEMYALPEGRRSLAPAGRQAEPAARR